MAIPDVKQTILNRGLGVLPDRATGVHVKVGPSSLGTDNVVVQVNDKASLKAAFGVGPLVEAAAFHLENAGGPLLCVRTPSSTPGAAGAITHTGTSTAAMTAPGSATDEFDVSVVLTAAGASLAAGTAAFQYSLDGGKSFSPSYAIPTAGTYLIPDTGLTLTWVTGTFVAGDTWTFTTSAPSSSQGEVMTAIDAAISDSATWRWVHVVGPASSVANSAGMFSALDSKMASAEASYRHAFAVMECASDTDANVKAAFASLTSDRVMVCAGEAWVYSAVAYGRAMQRNAAWLACQRMAKIAPGTDAAAVVDGSLKGVLSLARDENKTPGLDAARFTTLRSFTGYPGVYLTNARIFSAPGTDFEFSQHRRCMDIACDVNRIAMLKYLSAKLKVDRTTGHILEKEARAIEADVGGQLSQTLVATGEVSAVAVTVNRTDNLLSEKVLRSTVAITPDAYGKTIESTLTYFNPALSS